MEIWRQAEGSLAVTLKCFIRASSKMMTRAFVSDSGAICRLKSTSQSPHRSSPFFSALSLSHLLVFKILPPTGEGGSGSKLLTDQGVKSLGRQLSPDKMHSFDRVNFHEGSQYRCYPDFTLAEEQTDEQRLSHFIFQEISCFQLWDILLWVRVGMGAGINPRIKQTLFNTLDLGKSSHFLLKYTVK